MGLRHVAEFGKETALDISKGTVHDYLGMILDFKTAGELTVQMFNYIEGIMDELLSDMISTSATPASGHLFEIDDTKPVKLSQEKASSHHASHVLKP